MVTQAGLFMVIAANGLGQYCADSFPKGPSDGHLHPSIGSLEEVFPQISPLRLDRLRAP